MPIYRRHWKGTGLTLGEVLSDYQNKIVRVGTTHGRYLVCGTWNEELKKDLTYWERFKIETRKANIARMESILPQKRHDLKTMKRKLPRIQQEISDLSKKISDTRDEELDFAILKDKRLQEIDDHFNNYFQRKDDINDLEIGGLHGQARSGAKRSYLNWRRRKANKFKTTREKYERYLDEKEHRLKKQIREMGTRQEELKQQEYKLKIDIALNEKICSDYPGKIKRDKNYLRDYVPFIKREVFDIFPSQIKPGETSIIFTGIETGEFWDCDEFRKWKKTGKLIGEEGDENGIESGTEDQLERV